MKKIKFLAFVLSIAMIFCISPIQSFASSDDITLTVHYRDNGKVISDATFDVYLIATSDNNGAFIPTDAFKNYPVEFKASNDEEMYNLATTLEGYVLKDKIAPIYKGTTDDNGDFVFNTKNAANHRGLYLIIGHSHFKGDIIYTAEAFTIYLPGIGDSGQNLYEVTVQAKYTVVHRYSPPVHLKVHKVWNDNNSYDKRPSEINITLLKNGEAYDTVTLSQNNNWAYEWYNLDSTARWNIIEAAIDGYTVTITREGTSFFLKNTLKETPPPPPDLPQTGQLWWPVPILTLLGFVCIATGAAFYSRKKSIEK